MGAAVSLAAIDAEIDGPKAGLATFDAITDPALPRFQPAWTTRAHLLARAQRFDEARSAYRRAIELTNDRGVADYVHDRLESLVGAKSPSATVEGTGS